MPTEVSEKDFDPPTEVTAKDFDKPKAEAVTSQDEPGHATAAVRGALQGATSNFGDELAAGIDTAVSKAPLIRRLAQYLHDKNLPALTDPNVTYAQRRDAYRAANDAASTAHPLTYAGGQLAGTVAQQFMPAVPGLGAAAKGASVPSAIARYAAQGALSGVGGSTAQDLAGNALAGAGGALAGGVTGGLGAAVGKLAGSPLASKAIDAVGSKVSHAGPAAAGAALLTGHPGAAAAALAAPVAIKGARLSNDAIARLVAAAEAGQPGAVRTLTVLRNVPSVAAKLSGLAGGVAATPNEPEPPGVVLP